MRCDAQAYAAIAPPRHLNRTRAPAPRRRWWLLAVHGYAFGLGKCAQTVSHRMAPDASRKQTQPNETLKPGPTRPTPACEPPHDGTTPCRRRHADSEPAAAVAHHNP